MEPKNHYRLYKSGKQWLAALLVTAAIGAPMAFKTPVAHAADGSATAPATQTDKADWEKNQDALTAALASGGWTDLTVTTKDGAVPVHTFVAAVKDDNSFLTAWQAASNAVMLDTLKTALTLPDVTSAASQAKVTAFLDATSPVTGDAGKKNGDVIETILKTGTPSAAQPTPDLTKALTAVRDYITAAAKTPTPTKANWEINQAHLTAFLTDNHLADLAVDGQGTTLAAVVKKVDSDASFTQAWAAVANTIAMHEAANKMKLPDTTSAASQAKL